MKPSARKSYDKYKALIIHGSGRTEVVGRPDKGRTKRFSSRAEAINQAQKVIEARIEHANQES